MNVEGFPRAIKVHAIIKHVRLHTQTLSLLLPIVMDIIPNN
jgi:hypothetical protein